MRLSRGLFGIAVACFVTPLAAVRAQNCDHSANQREWNVCTANEAATQDRRLNELLSAISARADSARRAQLESVQQQWNMFRDADCRWQADAFSGGSIQPTVYSQCLTALTQARISELKVQLCEGFGVRGSCAASRRYDVPIAKRARAPKLGTRSP